MSAFSDNFFLWLKLVVAVSGHEMLQIDDRVLFSFLVVILVDFYSFIRNENNHKVKGVVPCIQNWSKSFNPMCSIFVVVM